jgi:hypothetical protein
MKTKTTLFEWLSCLVALAVLIPLWAMILRAIIKLVEVMP